MKNHAKVLAKTVDNSNKGYFPLTNALKKCYNRNERPTGDI